ncbi:hypothetical protein QFC22_001532 [Naganishia vaughanmartiniae]|uniref:Uncharacterized protein n=1 Tax=Naganishia vaughanmartiniae TaxID=1424756 RepID=A0ACC2XI64_9TREE|nr:hypothetical protein QFC22_001532 [Naganishia vaughanmartiniae]
MAYIKDQSHGNYKHYYVRRRANEQYPLPLERDERLALFDRELFKGKRILDVGCNSGEVAVELAQRYEALQVVGVDIDSALVDQCKATVEHAFSLQRPLPLLLDPSTSDEYSEPNASVTQEPSRKKRRLNDGARILQDHAAVEFEPSANADNADYFPAFFPSLFGTIDARAAKLQASIGNTKLPGSIKDTPDQTKKRRAQPPTTNGGIEHTSADPKVYAAFPRNLVFYAADWPKTKIESDIDGYDVILGLSLTKWIHLHDLDEGLVRFFQKCYDTLNPGGCLILEKQGWKGYKQAKRMSETLKQNYKLLQLRPETDFDRVLLETVGFSKKETVKSTETEKGKLKLYVEPHAQTLAERSPFAPLCESTGFDRDIEIYWKL